MSNTINVRHMTYTRINNDVFECHNHKTGKIWQVDRNDNPIFWAEVVGKFVADKDRRAGISKAAHQHCF